VDADDVAHDVTQPGSATLSALVDAFGSAVLDAEGSLDRVFVADVVFHDASALRRLNAITHAPIGVEIARRLDGPTARQSSRPFPSIAPSTAPCSPWTRCGPCRYRRRRPCDDSSTDADSVKPTRGPFGHADEQ